jgi:hypothetical protein
MLINALENIDSLRLPQLQALFAEVTGETTKSPNKKYLLRRIREGLDAQAAALLAAEQAKTTKEEPAIEEPVTTQDTEVDMASATEGEKRLSKMTVAELQARYLEVVGRPTGSSHKRYLIWKIREAQKGRIKTGPTYRRNPGEPAPDFMILPMRMETELVQRLDDARERIGLKSRMDLFRKAIAAYLASAGEAELAAAIEPSA